MSNYAHIGISPAPFVAGADLTSAQYKAMRLSGQNVTTNAAAASGAGFVGVLQNAPSANEVAEVAVLGPAKALCRTATCNLVAGRYLAAASDGLFEVPTTAGSPVVARYWGASLATAGASTVAEVFVFPMALVQVSAS